MVVSSTASTIGQYIGTMPVTGQVTPYGQVNVSGGQPLVSETHNQVFAVKMFREGDPAGDKALSARVLLGDNWTELVAKNKPVTGCP